MRVGSLFAGYGGIDLGLSMIWPDAQPAWFVEFDKHPSAILAKHWPNVPNYGDITKADWSQVEPVDVLTGGFPCQDVSHAGNRAGIKPGTRSGLWSHMAYAIAQLRPRLVVIENVSGLLSADAAGDVEPCPWCLGDEPAGHLRALGAVLADLAEIGFDAEWVSVRASDTGAPHRRERVFIVAAPAGDSARGCSWQPLAGGSGAGRPAGATGSAGSATAPHAGEQRLPFTEHEPGGAGRGGHASVGALAPAQGVGDDDAVALLPTPAVNDMGAGKTVDDWDAWTDAMRAKHGNGHGKSLEIEAQRLLPTPRATDGDKGGPNQTNGRGVRDSLPGVVTLLPTPTSRDGKGPNPNARTGGVDLPTAIERGTSHAPDDQAGTREALRDVRGSTTPQEVQWATGRPRSIQTPEVLRPDVQQLEEDGDEERAALASQEAPQAQLRGVRDGQRPARTPHRQEPREQRPGQPDDAVLVMSPEAALAGGPRQADEGRGEGVCDGCSAWGPYASAIHRWEVRLGRLAPPPTELNKDGRYRLSPLAVEFMMGVPAGWVTDTGISRNAQLKALGNGVVPQQLAHALTVLLPRLEQP